MTHERPPPTMAEFRAMVDRFNWYFPWANDPDESVRGREALAAIRDAMDVLGSEARAYYREKNPLKPKP